jgi:hypothetical protein
MIEFILKENIERRIKREVLAERYFADTVLLRITQPVQHFTLDNSIYFLINEKLDMPVTAKLILSSPDAFFSTSQTEYDTLKAHKNQSFRNNLKVETKNYGTEFVPFSLEFLKITPIND